MPVLFASDAKINADKLGADIAGGTFLFNDQVRATLADIPGMTATGDGGIGLTNRGALKYFAPGTARTAEGDGFLVEQASRNLLNNMNNVAPATTSGWSLLAARPAGATLTVVDDMTELYTAQDPVSGEYIFRDLIDQGRMNGKVVRAYNPHATDIFNIPCFNTVPSVQYAFTAYVRCVAGSGNLTMTGGGGSLPSDFSGPSWRRVGRKYAATVASEQVRLVVRPLSTIYILLAQLEEGEISSPIEIDGLPRSRARDQLYFDSMPILSRPCTIIVEVDFDRRDNIDRRMLSVQDGKGNEVVVLRHQDNSLSCTQTGAELRPGIARCWGPGRLRFALRLSPLGRTIGAGGTLHHDPVAPPPPGLNRLYLGAAPDGSQPMNGWVRSIKIVGELDDQALEAELAGPVDPDRFDFARFVDLDGDDGADGRTPATAWATLARVAAEDVALAVPTRGVVYLKRGGVWNETLSPQHYAVFRAYGTGDAPVTGEGVQYGLVSNDKTGFRVQDIDIRGATSRGANLFGRDGIQLYNMYVHHCGSPDDPSGAGIVNRATAAQPANYFYMGRIKVDHIVGDDNGDAIYVERIGRDIRLESLDVETPQGHDADCLQASQISPAQLGADAARVRLRGSRFDMKTLPSESGKGCVVIGAGWCLIEGCWGDGINFVYSLDSAVQIVRWNHAQGARLNDYSWAYGVGGARDVESCDWDENTASDCNRAVAFSANGTVPLPDGGTRLPYRKDVLVRHFKVDNCDIGIRVDAPTSGRIFGFEFTNVDLPEDIRPSASPPPDGLLYDDFFSGYHTIIA
jgi:hypothetical protein